MSIFGDNIKKLRSANQLSQQEFATLFNLSRGSVGSYEEGRADPKLETLIKIAKHFKISVDALLTKAQHHVEKVVVESPTKPTVTSVAKKIYLEDRVDALEKKLKSMEELLNAKNDD